MCYLILLTAFKHCLKIDFSSYMHVRSYLSRPVSFVDFVHKRCIVSFFFLFKVPIFGALLSGSCVVRVSYCLGCHL